MRGKKLVIIITVLLVWACEKQDDGVFKPTTFTKEEAYNFCIDKKFMTDAPKGQRGYKPEALFKTDAEDLMGLIYTLAPEKEPALVYYIEMAGAALPDSTQRNQFITHWADNIPWFAVDIVTAINYTMQNPDVETIRRAVDSIIPQLDTDETITLLVQQSFIRENMGPDGNGNGIYTILDEFITHWPKNYLLQCAENIRASNPGQNLIDVAVALERMAETAKD